MRPWPLPVTTIVQLWMRIECMLKCLLGGGSSHGSFLWVEPTLVMEQWDSCGGKQCPQKFHWGELTQLNDSWDEPPSMHGNEWVLSVNESWDSFHASTKYDPLTDSKDHLEPEGTDSRINTQDDKLTV